MSALFARFWYVPVIGALLLALAIQARTLDTVTANREAWKARAYDNKRISDGWMSSFRASEAVRARETKDARAAAAESASACDARVDQARRSGRAIAAIVTQEVPRDPQGCPSRVLVDPGRVRDALQPAAR